MDDMKIPESIKELQCSISRMVEAADVRQLRLIYTFVYHLTGGQKRDGKRQVADSEK